MAEQPADKKGKQIVTARLDPDLVRKLDALAKAQRRNRSDLLVFAVEDYVAKHEGELQKRGKP